ncbi:MAG: ISL3 family transposase, partial [Bryobacterales bacterium]|nr:ISL3 family transposase [Bryobacterales bacterium]
MRVRVRHAGPAACPHCGSVRLRSKGRCDRAVRHEDWGLRHVVIELEARKFQCRDCGRGFRQRFPGIQPWQRASEAFQRQIFRLHLDGINRSLLGRREGIGAATFQRYFEAGLRRQFGQWHPPRCPSVLGIDEHFFTRKKGFATTLCDLRRHKVYDVVLGRSETALAAYFERLEGKDQVKLVCMDLSSAYRSLVRNHFPNALIVADRFHVIRLINHHFLACWRELDPAGSRNRGLLSLMRRHRHNLKPEQLARLTDYLAGQPALQRIYRFKQRLCCLLLQKHKTRRQCRPLAARFLKALHQLRESGLAQLMEGF